MCSPRRSRAGVRPGPQRGPATEYIVPTQQVHVATVCIPRGTVAKGPEVAKGPKPTPRGDCCCLHGKTRRHCTDVQPEQGMCSLRLLDAGGPSRRLMLGPIGLLRPLCGVLTRNQGPICPVL